MKKIYAIALFGILSASLLGCAPASPPATSTSAPIDTPTPTLTSTPEPTDTSAPHSLVVIKSTLSGDLLGVLIQDTDSNGETLDTMGLGFACLAQGLYAVDEKGSRLECVQVTDATDVPDQIAIIFSGASSEHQYQLVRGEDAPIDLFPEQVNP